MRLRRNSLGRFLPRRRRNGGPKGPARSGALGAAIMRMQRTIERRGDYSAAEINRFEDLKDAYLRTARVQGRRSRRRNPAPKGRAKAHALLAAGSRRAGVAMRRGRRHRHVDRQFALIGAAARRMRNPLAALAGVSSVNPKPRSKHMARRRRSAAQRAATRRMIAANRSSRAPKRRRRRRARRPAVVRRRRKGAHMARRRRTVRRRRNPRAIMANPRRRRRRGGSHMRRVRRRHGRRRNPGMSGGIKGALRGVFMVGIPALGAGAVANFIDAKIADKSIIVRILAKIAQAAAYGVLFRSRPVVAYGAMGAAIGSIGGEFGTRIAGGVVVGATPVAKAQGVAALITEDARVMGVLVEGMRGMGYQIDNNVSLGGELPGGGQYQDVNLG